MWGTRVDGLSEVGRKMRHLAQSTLAIALVLYEEAYGLRPLSFVSVGLLGGLTCLLFTERWPVDAATHRSKLSFKLAHKF